MTEPLAVLLDDSHLLAVAKPAGLLTQGTVSGEPTLETAVRRRVGPSCFLGTVHRLDRPVSGVVVWARTEKAARRLSAQFEARRTVKEYWAVVEVEAGRAPAVGLEGVWDDRLTRSTDATGVVRVLEPGAVAGRRALTRFRRGEGGQTPDGTLWLRLYPETGRTHQLRVQAASRGMPVRGDTAYGSARPFPDGVALHARALTFEHPASRQTITVTAPIPSAWAEAGMKFPSE